MDMYNHHEKQNEILNIMPSHVLRKKAFRNM